MKVFKKLSEARVALQSRELTKSGHNKFAGYKYFELGDFLPAIQEIFNTVGLVDVISFTDEVATMTIYAHEDGSSVTFTSPMGSASLKGCHEVQNIGAVETYQRRYLYTVAMAVSEHDALDATTGGVAPEAKAKPKEATRSMGELTKEEDAPAYEKITAKSKPDTGGAKVIPTEPDPNKVLLVDSLIEFGSTCSTLSELTSLWKANQGQIDDLKVTEKTEYKRLQEGFAELKSKFKEEE
jgi:hypothetical protein